MNAFHYAELQQLAQLESSAVRREALGLAAVRLDPNGLPAQQVLDIVMSRRFGTDYRPVVDVQSQEVQGYQAKAAFHTASGQRISAGKMFAVLHRNPLLLYHTELEMKKLQIERAPQVGWLMLDLDIDSFMEGGAGQENPFLQLFRQHAWNEPELIINIVENHNLADAARAQQMIVLLQQSGTSVAMEDVGLRWGMFSLSAFVDARVIKFNRQALQGLNPRAAEATLDWLVSAARRIGVQTILDGVASCEHFDWAQRMGVDYVQGRLFARQHIRA
ncbi:EAL domain-containing protein [Methylobacillus flagellatus]|uniref:EAL domain-containing protein n=1 Tax=Methylobacillus flagellatus TaxID=405 RepID=UPI0010F9F4ED|nr:EAL domain-containing protein [Methylobacillus flagellatus]